MESLSKQKCQLEKERHDKNIEKTYGHLLRELEIEKEYQIKQEHSFVEYQNKMEELEKREQQKQEIIEKEVTNHLE